VKEVFVRPSTLLWGLFASAPILLAAETAFADGQRYPPAYVDRPLTLPAITLSPDLTFDATNAVKDPNQLDRQFETNIAFMLGAGFGITDDLEVRASIGTLQVAPKAQYSEPRLGATFRFANAENFNMGVHAEATVLTIPGEGGVRFEASFPMLVRLGSSARLDLNPGAPITIQENKATTFGVYLPAALSFQVVEIIHVGARSSATITDFNDPLANLVIPLGFYGGISLGSERPILELNPYFIWTEFGRPGAKCDTTVNPGCSPETISVEKFSAGLTARLYLYL
jgi:hypothetical protein